MTIYWSERYQEHRCREHLPAAGGLLIDNPQDDEYCHACYRLEKKKEWQETHSYPDEVTVEVWGGEPTIHLTNTSRYEFLEAMEKLWNSYVIDCKVDDGVEPGPVILRMSIEPEGK